MVSLERVANNAAMKLGLLGIDGQMAGVVAAAVARGDEVVVACDVPEGEWVAVVPPSARVAPWEVLVDAGSCDAVLVGGDGWNEARGEAVRKLVQAGRTLVLSQPLELSMLWAYELDMIRKDSGARLIPFLPDRLHPFTARLRREIEAGLGGGPLGTVETIDMTRRLADRSRESVLRHLARDADLVRVLVGDPQRLSTLGGAGSDAVWATLAVGLTGPAAVPARWQVARGEPAGLSITVVGSAGTCTVTIPDEGSGEWTWTTPAGRETQSFDRGGAILAVLDSNAEHGAGIGPAAWDDAARAIELAETVPRSVAKGRAIDLHQEEFSELGTFKGTMASLGCGLVLAALFVLLLATLVGGIAREAGWGFGERIAGVWPVAVLSVLGLFLALQLLPLLVAPAARTRDGKPTRSEPGT
jgi:predicted dehydrogenase